jgi:Domain of unknown function (DUF4190)
VGNPAWDDHDKAREALRTIVSDPVYGAAALSSSQTMANLLKDLLPDAPREASILTAAAEAGVAGNLQEHISQGMDVGTASALVAGSFAARMPFKPEACSWAVSEMAVALGLDPEGKSAPHGTSPPGGPQQTMTAAPGVGSGAGYPQGSNPQGSNPQGSNPQGGNPQGSYAQGGYAQGYPQGSNPQGGYQQGSNSQGGYPQAGQAPAPGGYPAAPGYAGHAPGVYQPAGGPGYWPQQTGQLATAKTNGLAIASLVLGIVWVFWLGSLTGLVLGLVALKQIKERNEGGRGIAIAGVVICAIGIAGFLLLVILGAVGAATTPSSGT